MQNMSLVQNWPLVGNLQIADFLAKSLANKNISSCYILTGPADIGKSTAARYFAKSLACLAQDKMDAPCGQCPSCLQADKGLHGDIFLIAKPLEKKNISIDQIRDFIRSLSLSSFLNSYKIGIIKNAENLSQGAVNALLKTLEEPQAKVTVILTVADLEILPKTIISRSQILRFQPIASSEIYDYLIKNQQSSRSQAKNLSRLAAGRPALALKFLEDKEYFENYKEWVLAFINFFSSDLNEGFKILASVLGEKSLGLEAASQAQKIIDVWKNLARDLILMNADAADLIQHQFFNKELEALKGKLKIKSLINLMHSLKQAKAYIDANVNPKLALEKVAANM